MVYDEKLKILKLSTLEVRRTRGDLIQVYKILNGLDNLKSDILNLVPRESDRPVTRGNSLRLKREVFTSKNRNDFAAQVTIRHNFFSNRVVPIWNALPDSVVSAHTLNSFKAGLDVFISSNGLLKINV